MVAKRIGQYVRERRRALGLSRAQLARRLGFMLGSVVSHVERGDAKIAPQAMADWARALDMEPAAFARDLAALGATGEQSDPEVDLARAAWA